MEEESLNGYLLRLSGANLYPNLQAITRQACLPPTFASRACDLSGLAALSSIDVASLEHLAPWSRNTLFTELRQVDLIHPRVCVQCLDEYRGARQVWDILLYVACPRHNRLLVDRCATCEHRLSWRRPDLGSCACGSKLRPGPEAPAPAVRLASWIDALAAATPVDLVDGTRITGLNQLLACAWLFGTLGVGGTGWRARYISKPSISVLVDTATAAATVLGTWPRGFEEWLDTQRDRRFERAAGVHASFGAVLRRVRRALPTPDHAFVYDAIRSYLSYKWTGGVVKSWSVFSPQRKGLVRNVAAVAAARSLGVSFSAIVRITDSGELPSLAKSLGSRVQRVIKSEDLNRYSDLRRSALEASEVAKRLGISPFQVERLRVSQLLHARFRTRRGFLFGDGDLKRFSEELIYKAAHVRGSMDLIRLSDVPQHHQARLDVIVAAAIADRTALFIQGLLHDDQPLFEQLWVARSASSSATAAPAGQISRRQAARELELAQRMVGILVKHGCLDTAPPVRGKQGVLRASLEIFNERYVLTRELASSRGISTRRAICLLRDRGIAPIVESDVSRGISAVWRRDDLTTAGMLLRPIEPAQSSHHALIRATV